MIESFEYERWANERWAETLCSVSGDLLRGRWAAQISSSGTWPSFPADVDPSERSSAIFCHILWAQRIWISRCGVDIEPATRQDAREWIRPLTQAWVRLVDSRDVFDKIAYRNTMGVEGKRTVGEIARHVLNHGTYHRGQLREAAEGIRGLELPSTDLILFFAQPDGR